MKFVFRVLGWKVVGDVLSVLCYVMIVVLYMLNWDGVLLVLMVFVLCILFYWFGKYMFFCFFFGFFMRIMGGIFVDCCCKGDFVVCMVKVFYS